VAVDVVELVRDLVESVLEESVMIGLLPDLFLANPLEEGVWPLILEWNNFVRWWNPL
jgi:hypothetical protein